MLSRDDFEDVRDELMERREELLRRADELRERFAEYADADMVVSVAGWTLLSAGLAVGVTQWIRGRRGVLALLLPISLLVAGVGMLGGGFVHRRGELIEAVEDDVRSRLAALDPIARYQILRDVGRETMPFVRHSHN